MTLRKQLLQQSIGGVVLLFVCWAFLNTPDDRVWKLTLSFALGLIAFTLATWLIATNFAAAMAMPRQRLLRVAGCLVAFLLVLAVIGYAEESAVIGKVSAWVSSAVALNLKRSLGPGRVFAGIHWVFFALHWVLLPLLFIKVIDRAVGVRTVHYRRLAAIYLPTFLAGAVIPHYLVHWTPRLAGFGLQAASAFVRLGCAYLILTTAWVVLGRSTHAGART